MDRTFEEILAKVPGLDRESKADLLDYLCISIVDEEWHYRTRGAAHEELILAALALSLENRTELRDLLMSEPPDPEIEQEWLEEIQRRLDAYDRGEMGWVSMEESLAHGRKLIEEYKLKHL